LKPERSPKYTKYDPLYDTGRLNIANEASFSPDGKLIAVAYSYRIYLWDVATSSIIHQLVDPKLEYEMSQGGIYHLQFSSDSSLLTSTAADGTAKIWDVKTGELQQTLNFGGKVWGITAISKDNKLFASSTANGVIKVYEISNSKLLSQFGKNNYNPSFSAPDIGLISVGIESKDFYNGKETSDIYEIQTGEKLDGMKGEFLTNGNLLVRNSDESMSIWTVEKK